MRRRPKPISSGRPASSWKKIPRTGWHPQIFTYGTGLLIDCPKHNCGGQIRTLAKPGRNGTLIVRCAACCTQQAVTLSGWESPVQGRPDLLRP